MLKSETSYRSDLPPETIDLGGVGTSNAGVENPEEASLSGQPTVAALSNLSTPVVAAFEKALDSESPIQLVYILGTHRSGASILGVLLAAHPDVFFAGELYKLPNPKWTPGGLCACNRLLRDCPFWSTVVRQLGGEEAMRALARGQVEFEKWAHLGGALSSKALDSEARQRHLSRNLEMIRTISRQSGRRIVLDGSKDPIRGRFLLGALRHGVPVQFIHLIRDGRSYVWSEMSRPGLKGNRFAWLVQNRGALVVRWTLINLVATGFQTAGAGHYLRIRFEDFSRNPETELTRIGNFLGIDLSAVIAGMKRGDPTPIGHVMAGDAFLRAQSTVVFRPERADSKSLSKGTQALYWALAGWLAGVLGYRWGRDERPGSNSPGALQRPRERTG